MHTLSKDSLQTNSPKSVKSISTHLVFSLRTKRSILFSIITESPKLYTSSPILLSNPYFTSGLSSLSQFNDVPKKSVLLLFILFDIIIASTPDIISTDRSTAFTFISKDLFIL